MRLTKETDMTETAALKALLSTPVRRHPPIIAAALGY